MSFELHLLKLSERSFLELVWHFVLVGSVCLTWLYAY